MLSFFLLLVLASSLAGELTYVAGCRLVKDSGEVLMTFPGRVCEFAHDGTFLSLGPSHLRRFAPGGKLLWEKDVLAERAEFSVTSRGEILLLEDKGETFHFIVLGADGKRIREASSREIWRDKKPHRVSEFRESRDGYFLNVPHEGLFLLSRTLAPTGEVLKFGKGHHARDVHWTREGKFVYLEIPSEDFEPMPTVSAVVYDPERRQVEFRFPPAPSGSFTFPRGGSLALSGEDLVINHPLSGTYLIRRSSGEVAEYVPETHIDINQIRVPDRVALEDLREFLGRWKF